ncbi:homoserine kinase [Alkanindiges sp. WGS2144]|uniref:homoserine kinase n=1 Tax=Alkanindiges sp. WGS2144 TaxID=3366808 RepID=UPI00375195EC
MSVYTPVTLQQAQQLASQYGYTVTALTPIQSGIENSNYFVQFETAPEMVLTIFEQLDFIDLQELLPLLTYLKQQGIQVASPVPDLQGHLVNFIDNKPVQLAPRLTGQHPMQPSLVQIEQIASTLAHIHVLLGNYPLHRTNNHGQDWWQNTKMQLQTRLSADDQALLDQVFVQFQQAQQHYPDRPVGLIHGDLFRDNTLFAGEQLSGVLDFSELSVDELLLDIAIAINDFCSDWPKVSLDPHKAQVFLQSYHTIRPLTPDEQQALPIYLAMAACRFWLSRLQIQLRNQQEKRTGEDILQKDPLEMQSMLQDRLQSPLAMCHLE